MRQNLGAYARKIEKTKTVTKSVADYAKKQDFDRMIGDFDSNTPVTVLTLTKEEIISPQLSQCIRQGVFKKIGDGTKLVIKCSDRDLAFNTDEAMNLIQNHEALKEIGGEMIFEETILRDNKLYYSDQSNPMSSRLINEVSMRGNLDDSNLKQRVEDALSKDPNIYEMIKSHILVSFPEMMEVNKKLTKLSEKINKLSKENNLSPYEKYLLCCEAIKGLTYYINDQNVYDPAQSYIETVQKNSGCCLGKAQYLRALLSMIGIKSCTVVVDSRREWATYYHEIDRQNLAQEKLDEVNKNEHERLGIDHAMNLIFLEDPKYGISGVFAGDAVSVGAPSTISLDGNLDTFLNYSMLYESGEEIFEFLDDLPTATEQGKDYSEFEKALKAYGKRFETGTQFESHRQKKAEEAFARLKRTKLSEFSLEQDDEIVNKINKIYKHYFEGIIRDVTEEDLECIKHRPAEFWRGVTKIDKFAFNKKRFESIEIPDCVKSIGDYAFAWCIDLKNIVISNSVTKIGAKALYRTTLEEENGKLTIEYEKGKFAKIKYEDFYTAAGVSLNGELKKDALDKMRETVKERVASGELEEVKNPQKRTINHRATETIARAAVFLKNMKNKAKEADGIER